MNLNLKADSLQVLDTEFIHIKNINKALICDIKLFVLCFKRVTLSGLVLDGKYIVEESNKKSKDLSSGLARNDGIPHSVELKFNPFHIDKECL